MRLYPSSKHVKEDSESNFSQASVQSYPKKKFELKSHDLKIKSERYIGRRNRNDDWDDVPKQYKYMHKYLPEVGEGQLDIHRYVEQIWNEDRWILVKRMFGMEFTSKLFYEMYTWVAFQSYKDKYNNLVECKTRCHKLFGHN